MRDSRTRQVALSSLACVLALSLACGATGSGPSTDEAGAPPDVVAVGDVHAQPDAGNTGEWDAVYGDVPPEATGDAAMGDATIGDASTGDPGRDLTRIEVPDPGFGTGAACPGACPASSVCRDGRCVRGALSVERPSAGTLAGAWIAASGRRTDFGAQRVDPARVEAWFATEDDPALLWIRLDADVPFSPDASTAATIEWYGVPLDGFGPKAPYDVVMLQNLAVTDLGGALADVALELGCRPADEVDAETLAALLVPWQMLLKYVHSDRVERAASAAEFASCDYGLRSAPGVPTVARALTLSRESPVPTVFGFFPFDAAGAIEVTASGERLTGDTQGPCGALCRGACGPDCTDVNCQVVQEGYECEKDPETKQNTGMKIEIQVLSCGSAGGCRDHDACYDLCNGAHGCGTWDAAYCRRDCDLEACMTWGFQTCTHWAQGAGPQEDERLNFTYPKPGTGPEEDQEKCPDPKEMVGTCWFEYAGTCGDVGCSSDYVCIEVKQKLCDLPNLSGMFTPPEPFDSIRLLWFNQGEECPAECTPMCTTTPGS